jgi:hypothetical protein
MSALGRVVPVAAGAIVAYSDSDSEPGTHVAMTETEVDSNVRIGEFVELNFIRANQSVYDAKLSSAMPYDNTEILQVHHFTLPTQVVGAGSASVTFEGRFFRELYKLDVRVLDVTAHFSLESDAYKLAIISERDSGGGVMPPRFGYTHDEEELSRVVNGYWKSTRAEVNSDKMCSLCICVRLYIDSLLKILLGVPSSSEHDVFTKQCEQAGTMLVFARIKVDRDKCKEYQISVHLFNTLYAISEYVQNVELSVSIGEKCHYIAVYVYITHLEGDERSDWEPKCLNSSQQKRKRSYMENTEQGQKRQKL